jgi:hypothetical protein
VQKEDKKTEEQLRRESVELEKGRNQERMKMKKRRQLSLCF